MTASLLSYIHCNGQMMLVYFLSYAITVSITNYCSGGAYNNWGAEVHIF